MKKSRNRKSQLLKPSAAVLQSVSGLALHQISIQFSTFLVHF